MQGQIQVYTGDGKGKTTAAFGLAVRAAGTGMKVAVVQFLKARKTGEVKSVEGIANISVHRVNTSAKFSWDMTPDEIREMEQEMRSGFELVKKLASSGEYGLLVIDEGNHVLHKEYVTREEMQDFLRQRPESLEVVITGRNAPQWLIDMADLVTEMRCIKHPMDGGLPARKGIEF